MPNKKAKNSFIGLWRINWMEAWDADFFDMESPASITIDKDNLGELHFGNVHGEIDGRAENGKFEFTWAGQAEEEEASGRGWFELEGEEITGAIYFHMGEESAFRTYYER